MNSGHVLGIGVDLVENDRMLQMLRRWGSNFKNRVFLAREQQYCDAKACPWHHYAGRFAVKEAVSKAFGTGVGPQLAWLDVEVVTDTFSGAPSVRLSEKGKKLAENINAGEILISLSHTRNYSVAQALLTERET